MNIILTLMLGMVLVGPHVEGSSIIIPSGPIGPAGGALTGTYPNPTLLNLTTLGSVPYVSSSGILNQSTEFVWNNVTSSLRVGGATSTTNDRYFRAENNGGFTYFGMNNSAGTVLTGGLAFSALVYSSSTSLQLGASAAVGGTFSVTTNNFLLGGGTDGNYRFDVQKSGSTGTARFFDQTATTGVTLVSISPGAGQASNPMFRLTGDVALPFLMSKTTAGGTAPTAGNCVMRWEVGTNAGSGKLVGYCGTSSTGVTIVDNVGAGF